MTQLGLAPEVEQLREIVCSFAQDRLRACAEDAEHERAIPQHILRSLTELGILSPLDAAVDQPLDPVALVVIAEELGAGDPGIAYETMSGAHAALAVSQLGSAEQLQAVLSRTSTEQLPLGSLWCYEGFGRGPDEYATTVVREADQLRVAGSKIAVVRPGQADFAVVIGRSDGRSVAVLLTREDAARCVVTRDDRAGGKLGLDAAHTGDIEVRDIAVPASALLEGTSELAVDKLVASARLSTAAVAVGAGAAALAYAAGYAQTRHAFGEPISNYQGVSFPLAEVDMDLKGARAAILDLALRLDHATDSEVLARETGQVIAAANRAALSATVTGVNTLGGHGFLTDYPLERWYRAAATLAAIDNDPLLVG